MHIGKPCTRIYVVFHRSKQDIQMLSHAGLYVYACTQPTLHIYVLELYSVNFQNVSNVNQLEQLWI